MPPGLAPPGEPAPEAAGAPARFRRVLAGIRQDRRQYLAQRLGLDLAELLAHVLDQPRQLVIGHQRQDGGARAHLPRAEFQRPDGPRLAQHADQRRAERGRPRIAALEFVEAARQFAGQPRLIHAEVLDDTGEIRAARIQQLGQEVLDLHVIVGPRQTQAGRSLQRRAHGVVQLGND